MCNENVIEIINKLCVTKEKNTLCEVNNIYTAIAYGYYFVRPGNDAKRFAKELLSAVSKGGGRRRAQLQKV